MPRSIKKVTWDGFDELDIVWVGAAFNGTDNMYLEHQFQIHACHIPELGCTVYRLQRVYWKPRTPEFKPSVMHHATAYDIGEAGYQNLVTYAINHAECMSELKETKY